MKNFKKTNKIIESSLMTDYIDKKFYTPHISTMNLLDGSMDFSGNGWNNLDIIKSPNVNEGDYISKAKFLSYSFPKPTFKISPSIPYILSFDAMSDVDNDRFLMDVTIDKMGKNNLFDIFSNTMEISSRFVDFTNNKRYERFNIKINELFEKPELLEYYKSGDYYLRAFSVSAGGSAIYFRKPMLTQSEFQTAYFPSVNDLLKIKQQKNNK